MPLQNTILNNAKELDQETGWYYYGARYYDPQVSRWLSMYPNANQKILELLKRKIIPLIVKNMNQNLITT